MEIYGLYGITHGWGRLLTLMSPEGAEAVAAAIEPAEDIDIVVRAGLLTQVYEKRRGGLARVVEVHGVTVLNGEDWAQRKAVLGDSVL